MERNEDLENTLLDLAGQFIQTDKGKALIAKAEAVKGDVEAFKQKLNDNKENKKAMGNMAEDYYYSSDDEEEDNDSKEDDVDDDGGSPTRGTEGSPGIEPRLAVRPGAFPLEGN